MANKLTKRQRAKRDPSNVSRATATKRTRRNYQEKHKQPWRIRRAKRPSW